MQDRTYAPGDMRSIKLDRKLLVGIGDIHGHYPALETLLDGLQSHYRIFRDRDALMLDADVELVFTGDYIDRGEQNRKVIRTAMELKKQNPGNVCQLFGNHELMALAALDKARELAGSGDAIDKYCYFTMHGRNGGETFIREFDADGTAMNEYIKNMSRGSEIGDWIRSLESMRLVRAHDRSVLFVHGGVPYSIVDRSDLQRYHDEFSRRMSRSTVTFGSLEKYYNADVVGKHSIFWDRRIPNSQDETEIREMAEDLNVDYIVIGHTPQKRITNYFDVAFNIDVGMTPAYGENEPAAIVFKPGGVFAFYARRGEEKLAEY